MLGFGFDQLAAKRKERRVGELYNATQIVNAIEITPVLRGHCCMQGPIEEPDLDIQKNKVISQAEKSFGKRSMNQRNHTRVESGTCNVCSAPCSSCMHLEQALMGSKTVEFSDETCRETMASQYSINDGDILPSCKGRPCDSLQHTASEASNMFSVNLSHDSFSENAESRATLRSPATYDASQDSEMHPKSSGAEVQLSPKPRNVSGQRILSNKYDDSKGVEGHDDNISCISRVNDSNTAVMSHHDRTIDIKNFVHSAASECSLGPESHEKASFSQKLDSLDVPLVIKSDTGAFSAKVLSPFSRSQSDKRHIGDSTEASTEMIPKSEPHTDKDCGDSPDEAFKCQAQDEQALSDMQEAPLQAMSGNESDESDIVEHDVKVCDICGDAGREDLLAICSKCSDGAEHTYCMQEMVRKVPEGNWLCEECQLAEDTENQKQGSDAEVEKTNKTSASTQSSGKRHAENLEAAPSSKRKAVETSMGSPKSSSPCKMPALSRDSSFKSLDKGKVRPASLSNHFSGDVLETAHSTGPSASTQNSGKRHAENLEAAPASKRQAIETSTGSPKSSSSCRMPALSRDSSSKSLDKGKVRPASLSNHSSSDVLETAHSTGPLLQTPKGTLLKSNSFSTLNTKPKVKPVDEVFPQKHKHEQTSFDMKEGNPRMMSKSLSFRSNSTRSSTSESKFKMLSPRFSHVHDLKGLKQVKERNTFERKKLSKLDRPLTGSTVAGSAVSTVKVDQKFTSHSETISPSSANNRESKVVKSEGKLSTLSKSTNNFSRKALELPVTQVGALSTSGNSISLIEQKPNIVSPKDEPSSSSSWTAERPLNNSSEILQAVPHSVESTSQGEKTSFRRPRHNLMMGSKGVLCQKCKEVGHDIECCPIGSLQVSGDVYAGRNSREAMIKGNKLKAAIEAAIPKLSVTYGRNRVSDQLDGSCMTNMDLDCERASQDSVANKTENMILVEGTHEVQTSLQSSISDSYKQTTVNHLKPLSGNSTDVVLPLRVWDSNSVAPFVGKTAIRDWSGHALAAMSLKMSAFPEHEYIWQGGFEVHRGGKLPELCDGIQAHLSSCASPKVLEVVDKFPQRIFLNEVPRLSTWPKKFHEDGAKEDNVALYFFAKDLESYERNYKGLLDSMIKNDLALRANQDGVELLIFPSSQLPENCQRWNMLFFLWGVFRVRKVNCSDSSKNPCVTGSKMLSLDRDVSTDAMSLSKNLCLPKHIGKDLSACDSSHDVASAAYDPDMTCITVNGDHDNKLVVQQYLGSRANFEQQDGRLDSGFSANLATVDAQLCPEMRCIFPSLEEGSLPECGQDTELKPCIQADRIDCGSNNSEKTEILGGSSVEDGSLRKIFPVVTEGIIVPEKQLDIVKSGRVQVDLERDLNEDGYMDTETALQRDMNPKGLRCWQSNHQKHPHLDLTKTAMSWNEVSVDQQSSSKKLITGFSGTYGCSSSRDRDSFSDGFSSQIDDLGPCSSVEEKRCIEFCDEKVIPEDLGNTERYFFPVGSQHAKDFLLGYPNGMPWKEPPLKDDGVPNLELALGAETKPQNMGMLPFFVGMVDKDNNNQDKPLDKEEENDVSASLSLSLSFPFPDPEQTPAVSKTEQLLPERHHVNTPLLFYRGLLDK